MAESVYLAYGYALTSPAMIVGDDGVIIVDPPEDVNKGRRTLQEFRKFSDKPVKAVIYSHWHIDHFGGVAAFASHEDAAACRSSIQIPLKIQQVGTSVSRCRNDWLLHPGADSIKVRSRVQALHLAHRYPGPGSPSSPLVAVGSRCGEPRLATAGGGAGDAP